MQPAAARLADVLAHVPIRRPAIPVVSNVTGQSVRDPDEIRRLLIAQVVSPVRWEESVAAMARADVTVFVEIGPGTSLSGLIRQTVPGARTLHVEDPASLEATVRALSHVARR
jgi:[acyl-carrier-protein] S-malonyltransferase